MAYYTMAEENNHRFLQLGWMLLFPPQEYFLNSWFSTKTVSMVDYHKTKKDLQAQELEWYKNPWKWKSSAPLSEVCRFCDCSFSTFADEGPQMQNFNLPREYIRNFFPKYQPHYSKKCELKPEIPCLHTNLANTRREQS